jgi:hypothetical protein
MDARAYRSKRGVPIGAALNTGVPHFVAAVHEQEPNLVAESTRRAVGDSLLQRIELAVAM